MQAQSNSDLWFISVRKAGALRIYLVKVFLSVRFSPNVKNTCISNLRRKPNSDFHFCVQMHQGIGVSLHFSLYPVRLNPAIVIGKQSICDGFAKTVIIMLLIENKPVVMQEEQL